MRRWDGTHRATDRRSHQSTMQARMSPTLNGGGVRGTTPTGRGQSSQPARLAQIPAVPWSRVGAAIGHVLWAARLRARDEPRSAAQITTLSASSAYGNEAIQLSCTCTGVRPSTIPHNQLCAWPPPAVLGTAQTSESHPSHASVALHCAPAGCAHAVSKELSVPQGRGCYRHCKAAAAELRRATYEARRRRTGGQASLAAWLATPARVPWRPRISA